MLNFAKRKPEGGGDLVKDGSEATFMADVIEASAQTPVIVDFWAPWCGPCKTLGPALESAVRAAGGKVRMVKIDIDQNKMLAAQMRIQSIPAVFAFVDGQPVDGFMGARPASEINAFVSGLASKAGGDDGADIGAAEELLASGAAVEAAQAFSVILSRDSGNADAYAGLVKSYLALGETRKAKSLIDNADDAMSSHQTLISLKARIDLAMEAEGAGDPRKHRARLERNPDDHQARHDLAMALLGTGAAEDAIEELLELFRRDRDWNDEAAKKLLFRIFDSIGAADPLAMTGRRRLSSLIFS